MERFDRVGTAKMWLLVACLLAVYFALVSSGFGPYITDEHPFRQTQTAMTARYFSGLGDFLDYQTPILGVPWSIPFEFPLYQAMAKGLQVATNLSLETSGRLVSISFFLLCFWPMHCLLREWKVMATPLVMVAVLFAPVYVFWSRSFMIETTALFFTLQYLAVFVRTTRAGKYGAGTLLLLIAVGALAALTKITTLLPILIVTMGTTAWFAVRKVQRRESVAGVVLLAASQGIIVAVALAWVAHTDAIKLLNPFGPELTSGALRNWTFGPLSQRVDPMIWFALANNTVDMYFPLPRTMAWLKASLAVGWLTLFVYLVWRCGPVRRRQVYMLIGLFLLPFMIFTNLHRIHNYYQAANGVYLCLAFGLAAYGAIESAPNSRRVQQTIGLYAVALLAFCLNSVWYLHHKNSHDGRLLGLSALVHRMSPPDSVIIVTGLDWSPELPYQASRRALMVPGWATFATVEAQMKQLKRSGHAASLYIACGRSTARDLQIQQLLAGGTQQPAARSDGCALYPI